VGLLQAKPCSRVLVDHIPKAEVGQMRQRTRVEEVVHRQPEEEELPVTWFGRGEDGRDMSPKRDQISLVADLKPPVEVGQLALAREVTDSQLFDVEVPN
jgi:hypothetical protein